jgi:hypothetical protein
MSIVADTPKTEPEAQERKSTTQHWHPLLEYFSTIKFEELPLSEQT